MASYFPACVDAVVVADNHHHVHSSALACAALLKAERTETLLSMITRDRNRIALESDVLGAASLGIESFLCLSGAHPSLGVSPSASGAYDLDSCQLSRALARMADEGLDFSGRPLESAPQLFIAAAAHPDLAPLELSLLGVRKKIAAGVDVLFTDAVTNLSSFERWMAALCAAGYQQRIAIIASVRPTELALVERLRRVDGLR
jgi:methylenetetrahydrofolate reductase (NADPH)